MLRLIVGGVIGWIAGMILGKDIPGGIIGNIIAGVLGSWIGGQFFGDFGPNWFGVEVLPTLLGAIILIVIVSFILNVFSV